VVRIGNTSFAAELRELANKLGHQLNLGHLGVGNVTGDGVVILATLSVAVSRVSEVSRVLVGAHVESKRDLE